MHENKTKHTLTFLITINHSVNNYQALIFRPFRKRFIEKCQENEQHINKTP